jgi:DNA (cytosine-5)-methyltransferase 3A
MRNENMIEPQNPQCVQTSVMVSADGLNVVSLFNGMNTGRQALENQGFKVNKYYSSEIKTYAIELTQHHFPDTIQVGDVTKWKEWDIDWKSINLILSGSPCQDLSAAGKRAGINGKKSSLFFVFIEILEHIKSLNPKVIFFQENVGSAPIKDIGIMSRALGVYPARFNSELVTAQLRDRYYWTNIKTKQTMFDVVVDIPEPKDRKIMFKDILTDGFTDREKARAILESEERLNTCLSKMHERYKKFGNVVYLEKYKDLISIENAKLKVKTNTVDGFQYATKDDCINLSFASSTTRRGRITKGKSPCLLQGNEPLFAFTGDNIRPLNKIELCRLQGFPDDYCDILTRNKAASLLGDGWTLPIVEHIFSFMHKTKH